MVVRQLQHESCDSLYDSLMTAYLRHWIAILVALALMPEAATTMPGILTSLLTCSLLSSLMEVDTASEVRVM